jgi:hypothetical protein
MSRITSPQPHHGAPTHIVGTDDNMEAGRTGLKTYAEAVEKEGIGLETATTMILSQSYTVSIEQRNQQMFTSELELLESEEVLYWTLVASIRVLLINSSVA